MGQDSNYALLKSSLDEARRRLPAPDFLLVSGDFLSHNWQLSYDKLAKQSQVADPQAYRAFTAKAIQFLAGELCGGTRRSRSCRPSVTTIPIAAIMPSIPTGRSPRCSRLPGRTLLGPEADRAAFQASFSQGGHCSLKLPRARNHRLIVVNSVVFSMKYANTCGTSNEAPAQNELRWLATALEQARAAGETVWLLLHIPPGIDGFATDQSLQKNGPIVTLWHPEWVNQFLQLIERYQGTIQAAFGGHMHMDDFRVIRLNDKPVLFCKVAPAISPVYGNNPGFQVVQYDRQTGEIEDYQLDYLTNLSTAGKPTAPATPPGP